MTVRDCQQLRFCAETLKYWKNSIIIISATLWGNVPSQSLNWTTSDTRPYLVKSPACMRISPGRVEFYQTDWYCNNVTLPSGILNSILDCMEWVSLRQTTLTPPLLSLPSASLSREWRLSGLILYPSSPSSDCQIPSISSWVARARPSQSSSLGLTVVILASILSQGFLLSPVSSQCSGILLVIRVPMTTWRYNVNF